MRSVASAAGTASISPDFTAWSHVNVHLVTTFPVLCLLASAGLSLRSWEPNTRAGSGPMRQAERRLCQWVGFALESLIGNGETASRCSTRTEPLHRPRNAPWTRSVRRASPRRRPELVPDAGSRMLLRTSSPSRTPAAGPIFNKYRTAETVLSSEATGILTGVWRVRASAVNDLLTLGPGRATDFMNGPPGSLHLSFQMIGDHP